MRICPHTGVWTFYMHVRMNSHLQSAIKIYKLEADLKTSLPSKSVFVIYPRMKTKPDNVLIQEELERRVLHGLMFHWEDSVSWLEPSYRYAMQKPLISIRDLKKRLGYWSPIRKEISLSRDLVMNHAWDAVLEVFYHEMAHQFAHQVLDAYHETSHGPAFIRACYILRANPEASGTYPPLDDRLDENRLSDQDKIMVKVKKLMALAQSHNRHEAESAMAKAHELISKYNIEIIEKNRQRQFMSIFLGKPALRHTRDVYELSSLLQSFYFVKGIWIPSYVIEKEKMGRVLEITGTLQNLKIASYVFDVVRNYIDSEWFKYNQKKRLNFHRKTDFAVGIVRGFRRKLELQVSPLKNFQDGNYAVAKIEDHHLNSYYRYRYPKISSFKRGGSSEDHGVISDGMDTGKKLVISKGIEESRQSGKYLPQK